MNQGSREDSNAISLAEIPRRYSIVYEVKPVVIERKKIFKKEVLHYIYNKTTKILTVKINLILASLKLKSNIIFNEITKICISVHFNFSYHYKT